MCIDIISTASWSPWRNEEQQPLHERGDAVPRLQCVEEVLRLSKLEQRTCLPRASRIGGTVRSGWSHDCSDTSTARYIIYNIEIWGCLKARNIQRKPTLLNVPWRFLFPPPPRREKNIHNLPKTPSH